MPVMNGFELAELMRGTERTRGVPIIFLTAMPSDGVRPFRGYEAGAVDFLHKPIDPRIIESKVGVFVELFEQRRALAQRNAERQRALQRNETMTAVLTHDLRSPLSAISVSAEVVRLACDRPGEVERVRRATEHIKTSSRRMSRMIEQLLDFSHIRSGAMRLKPQSARLDAACDAAVEELCLARPDVPVEVMREGDLVGRFDVDRMVQVFTNLLGNAVEHGGEGLVQVHLDGRDPARLRAEVSNPGVLPPEVAQDLFVPFRGQRERGKPGLGLGLYIVEQFVLAHGGRVSGRSEGERTVFAIDLPRHATGG
jgi:signal transduction histidine kinase